MREPNEAYIRVLARKPLKVIRRMQRTNTLLIGRAYEARQDAALEELQTREQEYMFAVLLQTE